MVGGSVHAPKSPTCGDKVYDFFVVSLGFSHAVEAVHTIGDAGTSPHCPVRLLLKSGPRSVMIRTLKAPKKFVAVLPHGPRTDQASGVLAPPLSATSPATSPARLTPLRLLVAMPSRPPRRSSFPTLASTTPRGASSPELRRSFRPSPATTRRRLRSMRGGVTARSSCGKRRAANPDRGVVVQPRFRMRGDWSPTGSRNSSPRRRRAGMSKRTPPSGNCSITSTGCWRTAKATRPSWLGSRASPRWY